MRLRGSRRRARSTTSATGLAAVGGAPSRRALGDHARLHRLLLPAARTSRSHPRHRAATGRASCSSRSRSTFSRRSASTSSSGTPGCWTSATSAFYAIGAYTVGVLTSAHGNLRVLGCAARSRSRWPCWRACCSARPTLRLRGDYLAIVTLGFGEIIRIAARNSELLGGPGASARSPARPSIRPAARSSAVLDREAVLLPRPHVHHPRHPHRANLERSRVGRAWTAIREDEDAAELMGVPTFKFKLWAFAMGAGVGGLAGALFASYQTSINPETSPPGLDPVPRGRRARRRRQRARA